MFFPPHEGISMTTLLALLALVVVSVCGTAYQGFNTNIAWTDDLEAGLSQAVASGKPAFVLIHKTWCGACKRLKSVFVESKEIEELSKAFVMVNLEDDQEPSDDKWKPDGGYIPRILFVSPKDRSIMNVINEGGNPQYKYYYASADQITASMKAALAQAK
jgi:protein-disulfide reductase (glutathione)